MISYSTVLQLIVDVRVLFGIETVSCLVFLWWWQIEAIRRGLLKVVPQAVLDLLTWQEVECRVSGDPEITIEALRRSGKSDRRKL